MDIRFRAGREKGREYMKGLILSGKRIIKRAIACVAACAVAFTTPSFSLYGVEFGKRVVKAANTVDFVNGGFEVKHGEDGCGWDTWIENGVNTSYEFSNYEPKSGSSCWALYFNADGEGTLYQPINLEPGVYTLSGYARDTNSKENKVGFYLNNNPLGTDATINSSGFTEFAGTIDLSDATEVTECWVTIKIQGLEGAWVCVDDVTIKPKEDDPVENTTVTRSDLKKLIDTVPSDLSTATFTSEEAVGEVESAKSLANTVYNDASATDDQIEEAYNALKNALDELSYSSTLFVTKIPSYDPDSIRGVDVSSYISIMNAFDVLNQEITDVSQKHGFRDADGNLLSKQDFFNLLAESGVNYVRTRVWVNPTDAEGNLYGGGNNDAEIAKEIATYVSNAGMKNLIDFHLSDLWTDPSKQRAPKSWRTMSIDDKMNAVKEHITSSLSTIESAGATVSMVQVGNETNNGVAGETTWTNMDKIFDAGCDAVHDYATANGRTKGKILAAVHFADPQKGEYSQYAANLADYDGDGDGVKEGVSYDVFASSYYPFFHGELSNLKTVLSQVASKYDKYVMVAETSWANSLDDGDGFDNQIRVGQNDKITTYAFTEQGQADEIRAVANAANEIDVKLTNGDKASLGFFYWEPAWIPVQNISGLEGDAYNSALAKNKELWESTGSGWASSYAGEYGDDEKLWYGGSSMDNQAVFDFDGKALETIKVFKYLAVGAKGQATLDSYSIDSVFITKGETYTLPSLVTLKYTDGSTEERAIEWDASSTEKVRSDRIGEYTIKGIPSGLSDYPIETTVTVLPVNLLVNPGFENGNLEPWSQVNESGVGIDFTDKDKNIRTGNHSYKYWHDSEFELELSQTVSVTEAGKYTGIAYLEGGDATGTVTISSGENSDKSEETTAPGFQSWSPMKATIDVSDASEENPVDVKITANIVGKAGAWGAIDDIWLYREDDPETLPQTTEITDDHSDSETTDTPTNTNSGSTSKKNTSAASSLNNSSTSSNNDSVSAVIPSVGTDTVKNSEKDSAKDTVKEAANNSSSDDLKNNDNKVTENDETTLSTEQTVEILSVENTTSEDKSGNKVAMTTTEYSDGSKKVEEVVKDSSTGSVLETVVTRISVDEDGKETIAIEVEKKDSGMTTKTSYEVNGSSKKTVTMKSVKTTSKATKVKLPNTIKANGAKYKVTTLKAKLIKGSKKINNVTIGKYVTKIEKNAFKAVSSKAIFKVRGSKKHFNKVVKLLKKSGVGENVTYKRA